MNLWILCYDVAVKTLCILFLLAEQDSMRASLPICMFRRTRLKLDSQSTGACQTGPVVSSPFALSPYKEGIGDFYVVQCILLILVFPAVERCVDKAIPRDHPLAARDTHTLCLASCRMTAEVQP